MTGGRALLSDGNFFILACTAGWWRRGYAEAGGVGRSEPPCHADVLSIYYNVLDSHQILLGAPRETGH